ncbi:MAG TPA: SMC-Scp complex subunit ScpB [Terriglobia bacterium]|nr:SMC-Scp complex subunit ScpB [Terriglobia bacterium]
MMAVPTYNNERPKKACDTVLPMLSDENLKALIEGILYVAPEPVSLEALARPIDGEERSRIQAALDRLIEEYEKPEHGIRIRQVAGGYKFSSKAEHHEVLRSFVKSLKPPIRLSKPALETLAVIAYRQPVTLAEVEDIRGVDCGGVTHTLLEKKLIATAGRKNVVGRPILYRTSREFLVHFGLRDLSELPSLREFEDLARQALGSELGASEAQEGLAQPETERAAAPGSASESGDEAAELTSKETEVPAPNEDESAAEEP